MELSELEEQYATIKLKEVKNILARIFVYLESKWGLTQIPYFSRSFKGFSIGFLNHQMTIDKNTINSSYIVQYLDLNNAIINNNKATPNLIYQCNDECSLYTTLDLLFHNLN